MGERCYNVWFTGRFLPYGSTLTALTWKWIGALVPALAPHSITT